MFLQFKSKFLCNSLKFLGICPKCHEDIVIDDKVFKEYSESISCHKCQIHYKIVNFKYNKHGLRIGIVYGTESSKDQSDG